MEIRIQNLSKTYGNVKALDDVSLTLQDGELFFLLGPSGCGKTTLLRCIGGFEQPTAGEIWLGDQPAAKLPPSERNTAMVFQGYALWPHMTVRENIAFGLETQKRPKAEIQQRVQEVMESIQIAELADRKPNQLSGGQQQRVALARTLVVHPGCLLLDEPLANLDAKFRRDMRREIRNICKTNQLTSIYVTHDRAEALSMADRIAVFNSGKIVQIGTPEEIYRRPVNAFVANFIGETNLREGKVLSRNADGSAVIATAVGNLTSTAITSDVSVGDQVLLSMRPEAFRRTTSDATAENPVQVTLRQGAYLGELADHIGDTADGQELKFYEINPHGRVDAGTQLTLTISPEDVVCLKP